MIFSKIINYALDLNGKPSRERRKSHGKSMFSLYQNENAIVYTISFTTNFSTFTNTKEKWRERESEREM